MTITCPICTHEADTECGHCGVRIIRNSRGEADRAQVRHPQQRNRWITVYQRRQNASLGGINDGDKREARQLRHLQRPYIDNEDADPLEVLTVQSPGSFSFGRGAR